jgi:hypothetical protein
MEFLLPKNNQRIIIFTGFHAIRQDKIVILHNIFVKTSFFGLTAQAGCL